MSSLITEALGTAVEAAQIDGARYWVRLIDAGQGSSGVYPASTLKQAAAEKVFPAGTHCYLDHPTEAEDRDRPERTIKDLAAVLSTDATYDPASESLVAEMRVFQPYRSLLGELKDDIGMSIRAWAEADDGIITRIVSAESVDFVTRAGRGGKILAVLESATEAATNDRRDQIEYAVQKTYADPDTDRYAHLRDFDETRRLAWFYADRTLWEQPFEPSADDTAVTLTGERTEVRAVTTYVPMIPATPAGDTTHQEASMPQIDEAELARLRAAESKVSTLESERDTTTQELAQEREQNAALLAQVKTANLAAIEATDLPAPAKAKITDAIEADPMQDVTALVAAEREYIAQITPQQPSGGFGNTIPAAESKPRVNAWGRTITQKGN